MQYNTVAAMEHLILMISKSQNAFHKVMPSMYTTITRNNDDWKARQG